jgi:hypothetical protein
VRSRIYAALGAGDLEKTGFRKSHDLTPEASQATH